MTKSVRIENADTNDSKSIVVEIWANAVGESPAILVFSEELNFPTMMTTKVLNDGNFMVVREKNK